jgi:hypothetical protein
MVADKLPFGPNSEAVLGLLRRLAAVNLLEAEHLVGVWRAESVVKRQRAHQAAQAAVIAYKRRDAARAAQDEAMAWLEAPLRPLDALIGQGVSMANNRDEAEARREAMPAVIDAVVALVLHDVLIPMDAEALLGPWEQVIRPSAA